MNQLLWVIFPYICLTVFVLGHVWRYRYDKFGWTTRSSQLYERRLLRLGSPLFHFGLLFVFLEIGREDAQQRVAHRGVHFFSAALVDSQFATLESPVGEPGVLPVDALEPIDTLQRRVHAWLHARTSA